tara:strand:- start:1056 stop:1247 length:192 start_codon:yes stop_codon:yes gene_type:complete
LLLQFLLQYLEPETGEFKQSSKSQVITSGLEFSSFLKGLELSSVLTGLQVSSGRRFLHNQHFS